MELILHCGLCTLRSDPTLKKKLFIIKFRISWIYLLSSWSKENTLENLSVILEEATQWKLPEFVILKEQLQEQKLPYALYIS